MESEFDLVIVGAGPGGYVAAIRAAQLGMKTAIVEHSHLGGICLNWGCIPTKALLKSAELYSSLSHLEEFGLHVGEAKFDFARIIQRSRESAERLSKGVAFLMRKNKIEVVEGTAILERTEDTPRVVVSLKTGGRRELHSPALILATGARPKVFPEIGLVPDGNRVWTYKEAMFPPRMPKTLTVIGSGAIGIEFASFYRALGADVLVIEAVDRILPVEDVEISSAAQKAFEKRGIRFKTGGKVEGLRLGSEVEVVVAGAGQQEVITSDAVILAMGIVGNVENLGLEDLGVAVDRSHVVTDEHSATNVPGLYAIGDVAGPPWLAHKASHEGVACVEHIAGVDDAKIKSLIPGCTYSQPAIASIGLTEARARELHSDIRVGRYPFRNNGKAIAIGDTEGFIKTIFHAKTGELLGAHLIGPEVTEMIQGFAIAMVLETTEEQLMATVFPHPSLSEAMHESVLDAYERALHA